MKRKFLSKLLIPLFCLALLGTAALADGDTGTDTDTETYVAQASETKTKYETFQEAYDACNLNTTGAIILLADTGFENVAGEYATISKNVSIWLNGHTFQSKNTDGDSIPTRVTGGSCTINGESKYSSGHFYGLEVSGGDATLYEIFDNVTLSGGKLSLPSATITGKLTVTGGELYISKTHNPTVGWLDVQNTTADIKLYAHNTTSLETTFQKITVSDGVEYKDLLADGADFSVKLSELSKGGQEIKIVNSNCTNTWNQDTGVCDYCGRQIYVAKVGSTGYSSVKDAISSGNSGTVILLADSGTSEEAGLISDRILDLNGHHYKGSIVPYCYEEGSWGKLTLKDSKGGGKLEKLELRGGEATLEQGYALRYVESKERITRSALSGTNTFNNVEVVQCTPHSYDDSVCKYCESPCPHASVDSDNKCAACGTPMKVYAENTSTGAKGYSTSLDAALDGYNKFKLLADHSDWVTTGTGSQLSIDLNGHSVKGISLGSDDASLNVTDTSAAGNGSIGELSVLRGSFQLSGGSYGKIVTNDYGSSYRDLLVSGYAYQSTVSGEMLTLDELPEPCDDDLVNVKAVKCPHDLNSTPCKYCGRTIVAVNNGTYYVSLETAIAEAKAGDTVKLLATVYDATIENAKNITLDLNGQHIYYTLTVKSKILITNSDTVEISSIGTLTTSNDLTVGDLLPEGWGFYNGTPKTWYDSSATATELDDVYVAKLPIQSVTLFSKKDSYVYSEDIDLDYTTTPDTVSQSIVWYQVKDGKETKLSVRPSFVTYDVGTYTFRLKVTVDDYTVTSNDVTVEVVKRTLIDGESYIAPKANAGLSYTGSNQPLVTAGTVLTGCTLKYRLDEEADWSTDIPDGQDAGTYTVYWMIEGGKNFKDLTDTAPIEVTIAPKTVTATVTIKDKIYTGLTYAEADTVTFTDDSSTYALTLDTDFYVNADFADANAGTGKTVSGTVTLTNDNYIFPNGTDELAFTATANIEKAPALTGDLMAVTLYRTVGSTEPQEVSVACVGMPTDAGTLSYSVLASNAYTATIDPQTGMLTVTGVSGTAGDSAHIKVNIESTNYETVEFDILVKLTDKVLPTLSVEDITTTYTGDAIPHSIIKGTATVDGKTVVGGWNWNGAAPKNVADSGTITVIFTPNDSTTYAPTTTNITVTINKATPPQPTFDPIDPDYDLNWLHDAGKHIDADVDFYWVEENELIVQGKEYHWRMTDPNGNYEDLTGSVILWPAPASSSSSGGGSSSSSSANTTTTAKQNPDGSTTVSVSSKDAKSGETVTLPVEVNTENPSEINVNIPKNSSVTVEIPVENVTPGTVVVIVDENGNETVVATTGLTENGVTVTLTENCTIKVIENSKDFDDVPENSYYGDAVAWASAREITGGVGGNNFGAENDCGRAQLVTFLWRAAGQPEVEGDHSFSDVEENSYYTEAVKWAASLGIVNGYDSGLFGTDDTITREQMAVILYRFAQKTGLDTTQGGMAVREFADYEDISDYAIAAMQWAVNAGVMQGYAGSLMPGAECTRAQIVTMLYRLLGM